MIQDEFDFDRYNWSIEDVSLDLLTHSESFYQGRSANDEKPPHSHVYYELLFSASDGSAEFLYEDQRVTLSRNAFVITSPYYTHRAVVNRCEDLFSLGFLYKPNHQKEASRQDLHRLFCQVFAGNNCIIGQGDETLAGLCRQLKRYSVVSDSLAEGSLVASFLLVLFHVMTLLRDGERTGEIILVKQQSEANRRQGSRIPSDIASKINNILSESFMTDVTPEELSGRYYLSAKQINRYICKQYGQTFMQRKHELRMSYAQKLLRESDCSIREISEKVGFHSINSFYSAFKARFGVTPNQYRTMGEPTGDAQPAKPEELIH